MNNPTPTDYQKVRVYEALLHRIQMGAEVAMNYDFVNDLVKNICVWSSIDRAEYYGEGSEEKRQQALNRAFWSLLQTRTDKTDLSEYYKKL
jgi:hypothetical protein